MTQLAGLLRIASTLACGIVLIAFAAWATDETKSASDQQAAQVPSASQGLGAPPAAAAEPEHDGLRGAIETANDKLVAPFEGVTNSTNEWVQRGMPALLALLAYGLLARMLIAYLPQR